MRLPWRVMLSGLLVAACADRSPITPPRDAAADRSSSGPGATDASRSDARRDASDGGPNAGVDARDGTNVSADEHAESGADAPADGEHAESGADAHGDGCVGGLSLRLAWTITAMNSDTALTCAEVSANAVYVIVDGQTFKLACADGADTVVGLAPGVHTVRIELVQGATLTSPARAAAPNPTSCVNDIDCVATPACGGDVCDYSSGFPTCKPAGAAPQGADGWCMRDTDCKCHAQGATCNGIYCSFTRPDETVLSMISLPPFDYGCGVADLGNIILVR